MTTPPPTAPHPNGHAADPSRPPLGLRSIELPPELEASALPFDRLSQFVRFAGMVETIGGIEKAKAYLKVMEQLRATI